MIILVATEDELRLAKKHLGEYEIVKTGVGAGNVIRCCSQLLFRKGIENERIVNLGFCGSNNSGWDCRESFENLAADGQRR